MSITNIKIKINPTFNLKDVYKTACHQLRKHDRHDLKEKLKTEWSNSNNNETDRLKIISKYVILPKNYTYKKENF